jgi:hypothetical protein
MKGGINSCELRKKLEFIDANTGAQLLREGPFFQ